MPTSNRYATRPLPVRWTSHHPVGLQRGVGDAAQCTGRAGVRVDRRPVLGNDHPACHHRPRIARVGVSLLPAGKRRISPHKKVGKAGAASIRRPRVALRSGLHADLCRLAGQGPDSGPGHRHRRCLDCGHRRCQLLCGGYSGPWSLRGIRRSHDQFVAGMKAGVRGASESTCALSPKLRSARFFESLTLPADLVRVAQSAVFSFGLTPTALIAATCHLSIRQT